MNDPIPPTPPRNRLWYYDLLMVVVLLAAVFFRFSGLLWGENSYLHPDERFLVWVAADISSVQNLDEYFDTPNSSLNPHNRGHGFYVYGTLPMFLTRYTVEALYGQNMVSQGVRAAAEAISIPWKSTGIGWSEILLVGRSLSALFDLGTLLLVAAVARRLYDRRVSLLATAFGAGVVLQIQQSHFFTMDTFTTCFSLLAIYFAVVAAGKTRDGGLLWPSLGFGVALGMAVASKLNAAPVAAVLPLALAVYFLRSEPRPKVLTAGKSPSEASDRTYEAARRHHEWEAQRKRSLVNLLVLLILAAFVSLVVFRIFQPYAFSGPGFFGLKPNELWIKNILEQRAQAGRDVDFPPAMQWARRPITFSLQNMVLWGFGLPLGILAWAGFLWAGWRMFTGWNARREASLAHAMIWLWTAVYFTWQSLQFNPTMRYQLPIYPTLVIFAAWLIVHLCDRAPDEARASRVMSAISRWSAILFGGLVLLATFAYAFAFSRIYERPVTRVAATRWIYKNIPGPINLPIQTPQGVQNQILPYPYEFSIQPGKPFNSVFTPRTAGTLTEVVLPRVQDPLASDQPITLTLTISPIGDNAQVLASGQQTGWLRAAGDSLGEQFIIPLDAPLKLDPAQPLHMILSVEQPEVASFSGEITVYITPNPGEGPGMFSMTLQAENLSPQINAPYVLQFQPSAGGTLSQLQLSQSPEVGTLPRPISISLTPEIPMGPDEAVFSDLVPVDDPQVQGTVYLLTKPIEVVKGELYRLSLRLQMGAAAIRLNGMGVATEGDWDDGLPLRIDGYDGYGGIYPTDLNFNMYWDDNPEKLERFLRILDAADYLTISSNRQWGTLPRIPERFPMTTLYYRLLMGCPDNVNVVTCYRDAEPGKHSGELGFELREVFVSEPCIGRWCLNDQYAEEAFSVYDHPQVLIFQKTAEYDSQKARQLLSAVDFDKIIRKPPLQYGDGAENLLLPPDRWADQQAGGTWQALFNSSALINRYPVLSVVAWYLTILILGILAYPLLRLALPGLEDRGYPLARSAGMLFLSYIVWLGGSAGIEVTSGRIGLVMLILTGVSVLLIYLRRDEISSEIRQRKWYFLVVEALFLAVFVAGLLIRLGNPDLWHPWKGGEKPMDFAYFNAVLKSSTFPPYDPWYAGGYLNYYYYGFVLVGTVTRFLGITPAVAYNLIVPTIFALIALGAFSIAWNLVTHRDISQIDTVGEMAAITTLPPDTPPTTATPPSVNRRPAPYLPALAAVLAVAILGNLGTVRMIYQGFQRLATSPELLEEASLPQRWLLAFEGFGKALSGDKLPYGVGDWYWLPSRAIPASGDIEPITEFPLFTVLYADPHAHLYALPLTLLALSCAVGFVFSRRRWRSLSLAAWFGLAALAIGVLRPTNTWDMPTYLALNLAAIFYAVYSRSPLRLPAGWLRRLPALAEIPGNIVRLTASLGSAGLLTGLAFLFFRPYGQWYTLAYTKVRLWEGATTPSYSYFIHWGLFLFVLLFWVAWETRQWMAQTPAYALKKLVPYRSLIVGLLILLVAAVIVTNLMGARISWFVLPFGVWVTVLMLRPGLPTAKRMVLFLVGTGLVLTLMVEIIVLEGDIGRMNTVFKFYLQVWSLFGISAAAALGWTLPELHLWRPGWNALYQAGLTALVAGAGLFTVMATLAKIDDRMVTTAPHTLDGMAFMQSAQYTDEWGTMDLSQDYRAIRWLQDNVTGSPVIVEANLRNLYRWGSRMSIYTGLPGVVGWEWHQQQQRAALPAIWVSERIQEIDNFYITTDLGQAGDFLKKYNVRYIIVGQQERGHYPGPGLEKFDDAAGLLWQEVYRDGETVIYEVIG